MDEITKLYREMELELIHSMKKNLALHLAEEVKTGIEYPQWQAIKLRELQQYFKENRAIVRKYVSDLPADVSKQMQDELRQGYDHEFALYEQALGKGYKSAKTVKDSFFGIDAGKVDGLINALTNDLNTANTAVLRMINDTYRQTIFKYTMFASSGVYTKRKAYDMAVKDFLSRGLNCIEYKDGRRVNIADYADMAIRTANQRAYMVGQGSFRQSLGRTLIIISKHQTSCDLCKPFERKVLIDDVYSGGTENDGDYMLLSEAMKLGLYHPRCRHGSGVYFPELDDLDKEYGFYVEDADQYDDERAQNAHVENQIQKYKRLYEGSIDPENRRTYLARLQEWENKKKTPKTVEKFAGSDIMGTVKNLTTEAVSDVHSVGKIDIDKYRCITPDIKTDEVIITEERIQHIKERHPSDYERYVEYMPRIISDPDYIIEANKANTAVILKEIEDQGEKFKLILRLKVEKDPTDYKNSVISFWKIGETTWKKSIKNKKILYKKE